jgi:mono/diheme cytochrome c family protein
MTYRRTLAITFVAGLLASAAFAITPEPGDVERGHEFAKDNCATCHAVEKTGASPYAPAPPFRTLHEKYDVEGLAEALAEGIVVGHDGPRPMPEFVLEPDEIDDLLAYLKSLEK